MTHVTKPTATDARPDSRRHLTPSGSVHMPPSRLAAAKSERASQKRKRSVWEWLLAPFGTVRGRMLSAAIIVETIMLTLMVANGVRLLDTSMSEQVDTFARQISPVLSAALVAPLLQRDQATVQAILDESQAVDGVSYVAVSDPSGKVVAVSGWPKEQPLPDVRQTVALFDGVARHDLAHDLAFAGQRLGQLHFGIDLTSIRRARHNLVVQGLVIAGLEILASALTLGFLGAWLTRHLRRLARASEDVARGTFTFPPVAEGADEIGRLGAAFNAMSRAVQERQAEMASINAELRNLSIVAAHHLQEPVRPLVSYSQLIVQQYAADDPEAKEWMGYVHVAGSRMKALLRDFERYISLLSQTPNLEPQLVSEVIHVAADRALAHAGGASLSFDFPPGCYVVADRRMLIEMLTQLFDNAWNHRGDRERIAITVSAREAPDEVAFAVSDNGPGIPPELLDRVVRPFERVGGARSTSTGFGLAFCALVARAHGGAMSIDSGQGGTSVRFTLPIQEPLRTDKEGAP